MIFVCIMKCEGGKFVIILFFLDSVEIVLFVLRSRESGDLYVIFVCSVFCNDGKFVLVLFVLSSLESESGKFVIILFVLSSLESEDW